MLRPISMAVAGLALVAIAACGAGEGVGSTPTGYVCDGQFISEQDLADGGRPAREVFDEDHPAFSADDLPSEREMRAYRVVVEESRRLVLLQEGVVGSPESYYLAVPHMPTHYYIAIERRGIRTSWQLSSSGSCHMGRDIGSLRHVRLESANEAVRGGTELELFVFACDQSFEGSREFRLVQVTETDTEVRVIAGMVPEGQPMIETCYPHEGSITIELTEPLGERTLINDTSYPPRAVPTRSG